MDAITNAAASNGVSKPAEATSTFSQSCRKPRSEPDTSPSSPQEGIFDSRQPSPPDAQTLAEAVREAHATNLQERAGASYLYGSIGPVFGQGVGSDAYVEYRNKLLKNCGSPDDPIEIMLIEQLALAHHNVGRLHMKSAAANAHDASVAYAGAATRLFAEFRRTALALQEYRHHSRKDPKVADSEGGAGKATTRPENGTNSPRTNSGQNASHTKLCSREGLHPWLQKRLQLPTPVESQPADATGSNGEA